MRPTATEQEQQGSRGQEEIAFSERSTGYWENEWGATHFKIHRCEVSEASGMNRQSQKPPERKHQTNKLRSENCWEFPTVMEEGHKLGNVYQNPRKTRSGTPHPSTSRQCLETVSVVLPEEELLPAARWSLYVPW